MPPSRLTSTARNHGGSGKGDRDRTTDRQAYRENYERIFGKPKERCPWRQCTYKCPMFPTCKEKPNE